MALHHILWGGEDNEKWHYAVEKILGDRMGQAEVLEGVVWRSASVRGTFTLSSVPAPLWGRARVGGKGCLRALPDASSPSPHPEPSPLVGEGGRLPSDCTALIRNLPL